MDGMGFYRNSIARLCALALLPLMGLSARVDAAGTSPAEVDTAVSISYIDADSGATYSASSNTVRFLVAPTVAVTGPGSPGLATGPGSPAGGGPTTSSAAGGPVSSGPSSSSPSTSISAYPPAQPLYGLSYSDQWFFMTAFAGEDTQLASHGWTNVLLGGVYPTADATPGLAPLYRLYYPGSGDHFYTTSADEVNSAVAGGYTLECIACYVFPAQFPATVPLYRAYNPETGQHRYTTHNDEFDASWNIEGIQCFVLL